jgi:ribosomal protein L24
MSKQTICKGDKVTIIRGEGATHIDPETQKAVICTVLQVDRLKQRALLDIPRPKQKRAEKQKPVRGVEIWKTARYNPKTGEAGGLKIVKRPIHLSNLQLVEKGPRREFKTKEE